jgi:hypothetical protein
MEDGEGGLGEIEKKEDVKGKEGEDKKKMGRRCRRKGGEGAGRPGKMEDYCRKRGERAEENGAWKIGRTGWKTCEKTMETSKIWK